MHFRTVIGRSVPSCRGFLKIWARGATISHGWWVVTRYLSRFSSRMVPITMFLKISFHLMIMLESFSSLLQCGRQVTIEDDRLKDATAPEFTQLNEGAWSSPSRGRGERGDLWLAVQQKPDPDMILIRSGLLGSSPPWWHLAVALLHGSSLYLFLFIGGGEGCWGAREKLSLAYPTPLLGEQNFFPLLWGFTE